jgi:hypothetical protein
VRPWLEDTDDEAVSGVIDVWAEDGKGIAVLAVGECGQGGFGGGGVANRHLGCDLNGFCVLETPDVEG